MGFAPGMWFERMFDSGNGFGEIISGSVFESADFDRSELPDIRDIEDPPLKLAGVERSQYQDVSNDSDFIEFSSL